MSYVSRQTPNLLDRDIATITSIAGELNGSLELNAFSLQACLLPPDPPFSRTAVLLHLWGDQPRVEDLVKTP